jgi:hypothetical protein
MTTFKTFLGIAAVVALGAAGLGPSPALAKVFVSPQSNARGNLSGPVPAPTFRQIVGSGPVTLGRRPIGSPLPACQSRVCLTGGG